MLNLSGVRVIRRLLSVSLFLFYIIVGFGQKLVSGPILLPKNDSCDTHWLLVKKKKAIRFESNEKLTVLEDTIVNHFFKRKRAYQLFVSKKLNSSYYLKLYNHKGDLLFHETYEKHHPSNNSYLFGSCAFIPHGITSIYRPNKMNKIYRTMSKENAHKMFWLGDNVYLFPNVDTEKLVRIYRRYLGVRKDRSLKMFLSSGVEHHAIWDDHDFGPNNASGLFNNVGLTTLAFKSFWNKFNLKQDSGIYEVLKTKNIDFFLLDCRTFLKVKKSSFLGNTQLNWLKKELAQSNAKFKFLLFSNQVINPKTNHETINRGLFKKEKEELFDFIQKKKINGVIFFSGDRHFAELHVDDTKNYPLYDFTTSPLSSPRHHLFFKEEKKNTATRVAGSFFTNKNYLKCTLKEQNNLSFLFFELKNKHGKQVFKLQLSEKDLGH